MRLIVLFMLSLFCSGLLYADTGRFIDYKVDNNFYEAYYISSDDDAPFVLLLHDWDGLTDYEIKRANMLNKLGYSVFVADLFGKGIRPTEIKDKRQHTGELYKDRNKMRQIINAALRESKKLGANIDNAIAVGYCFGGAAVLELARSGADLKGFVTFHGGLTKPDDQDYSKIKGKILVLHGTADTAITMDQFAALANELEKEKIPHEMISYGGAQHAFTVFDSKRYNKKADQESWIRFLAFLKSNT